MAIAYQTQYDALSVLRNGHILTDKVSFDDWSACMRPLIIEAQTRAIAGDADAITFLSNPLNRLFLRNADMVNRVITYNGVPQTINAGTAYCLHPDEQRFFLEQAAQKGFNFVNDPLGAAFIGGIGDIRFFYF